MLINQLQNKSIANWERERRGQTDGEKIDSEKAVATESRDWVVFVPEAGQGSFFQAGGFADYPPLIPHTD